MNNTNLICIDQIKDDSCFYYYTNNDYIMFSVNNINFLKTQYVLSLTSQVDKINNLKINNQEITYLLIYLKDYFKIPQKYVPEIINISDLAIKENKNKKYFLKTIKIYKIIIKPQLISYIEQTSYDDLKLKDIPLLEKFEINNNKFQIFKGIEYINNINYILNEIIPYKKNGYLNKIKYKNLYEKAKKIRKIKDIIKKNYNNLIFRNKYNQKLIEITKELQNEIEFEKFKEKNDLEKYQKSKDILVKFLKSLQEHDNGLEFDEYIDNWAKRLLEHK